MVLWPYAQLRIFFSGKFGDDMAPGARQNKAMRAFLCLVLLTAVSCQSSPLQEGDAQFQMGHYAEALALYQQMPVGQRDEARIQRTRYFVLEDGVRQLLNLDRPQDAARVLAFIEADAPVDRQAELERLRQRIQLQTAQDYYVQGYELSEANHPLAATERLRLALSWNPNHAQAKELLAQSENWLSTRQRVGEDYYFQGMEHLRAHHDLRARTAFMHAADLLGEDSLAATRLDALTLSLAEESRNLGRLYLEAGLTGPAWVALLDSLHLDPQNAETLELAKGIEAQVRSAELLTEIDVAVRGGATQAADQLLEKAQGYGVAQHVQRLRELAAANQNQKNQGRYVRARAYELDGQMVHAQALYQAILDEGSGLGWEDVEIRLQAIGERLQQAEEAYQQALAAEQDGNAEAYRRFLTAVMHLAVDYKDVRSRFQALAGGQE